MNTELILPRIYASNPYPLQNTGYRTVTVQPKPYGFRIVRFSNYISLQYIKVVFNDNGFSKATVKVDTNYRSKYQYTIYFDNNGDVIRSEDNNTHSERNKWIELQIIKP